MREILYSDSYSRYFYVKIFINDQDFCLNAWKFVYLAIFRLKYLARTNASSNMYSSSRIRSFISRFIKLFIVLMPFFSVFLYFFFSLFNAITNLQKYTLSSDHVSLYYLHINEVFLIALNTPVFSQTSLYCLCLSVN